ncbi:hypothetical protein EUAN_07280 [Andreesenia angusta]|uniref:Lipoprotein n=1 Tax=Andreesenia angusta TaxID=39480 RepID=A0A1S1V8W1_9FIRM|nr:hypothetical protein [Andreesenia angusta]OHW62944.1 hypothetical protein EUAN_07280 [Andreesenia angusta]
MKRGKSIVLGLSVSMALLFSACNSEDSKSQDTTVNEKVEDTSKQEDNSSNQESDSSKPTAPEAVSLPEGFPSEEFPLMDGAVITESRLHDDGDMTVAFSTAKSTEEVKSFYRDVMQSASDVSTEDDDYFIKGKKSGWETKIKVSPDQGDASKSNVVMDLEKE